MSIGLQIICTQCRKSVYVGTMNSMTDEDPKRTAAFLWKHRMHDMTTVDESHPSYYEWAECADDLQDDEATP